MSEHVYQRNHVGTGWDVDLPSLSQEVRVVLPGRDFKVRAVGLEVIFDFELDLDQNEIETLNQAVADHKAAAAARLLADAKAVKYGAIDQKTQEIIAQGFEYNGVIHSLSSHAQRNWLGMIIAKDMLSYPIEIPSLDDSDNGVLSNAAEVEVFYGMALMAVRNAQDSGTVLKDQVRACQTVEAMSAVVDPR